MVHFPGTQYRSHTVCVTDRIDYTGLVLVCPAAPASLLTLPPQSCMTEEQKYHGALYKNKKVKPNPTTPEAPKATMATMTHLAYVEDVPEDYMDYQIDDDGKTVASALPHAPTPPPADDAKVDVFDFLVAGATPNASNLKLPQDDALKEGDSTSLVRYDYEANAYVDPTGYEADDKKSMVQYGTGPVPVHTPANKSERRKSKEGAKDANKDKKRKRLHVDVPMDEPPVLHSGLTGGLNRLMSRPSVFPPSPEYSADAAETPASPLKKSKSKHSKHRGEGIGNNLMSMLTSKPKKKKSSSSKKHREHREHRHKSDGEKGPKLIEYRPGSKDSKSGDASQMVVYKPRADLLLSLVNKGPDSERGCSMNKALKRFHRERSASGNSLGKPMEEKELWRSLRLRKNDRGEIVLFSI